MKEASYQAGIKDSKVVLFVEEDVSNDVQCIDDLCSLIRDGKQFKQDLFWVFFLLLIF